MREITMHDVLVRYPLVSENAPEWKRVCPFCGAVDMVHEAGDDIYVCHECHANWLEIDTPTERRIQVLHLNSGTMPEEGFGEMPIVFCDNLSSNYTRRADIDMRNMVAVFYDVHGKPAKVIGLTGDNISVLFSKGEAYYDRYARG